MEKSVLANASENIALRVISRLIAAVGGLVHIPARAAVKRLYNEFLVGSCKTMTLGRCQFHTLGAYIEVYRERRNLPEPLIFHAGRSVIWDGRFEVVFGEVPAKSLGCLYLQNLNTLDLCQPHSEDPNLFSQRLIPAPALAGLPALCDDRGILSVPHIEYFSRRPMAEKYPGNRYKEGALQALTVRFNWEFLCCLSGFKYYFYRVTIEIAKRRKG